MPNPIVLKTEPRVRFEDDLDEAQTASQVIHTSFDPLKRVHVAESMGIRCEHPLARQALADCEAKLAASPEVWTQPVDRHFRPVG